MLDYDAEAPLYDASRGGEVRAGAAATRPGCRCSAVDKNAAHHLGSGSAGTPASDDAVGVEALCRSYQLVGAGGTTFIGHGQDHDGEPDPVFSLVSYVRSGPAANRTHHTRRFG